MAGTERRIHPVVMAGGGGTRLWPLSRALYPKQFFPLTGGESLLQDTVKRVTDTQTFAPPLILANAEHRFLVAEQLRQSGLAPADIVLEPFGRNTAPAVCIAALTLAQRDPDALMLLLAADHAIAEPEGLIQAVKTAAGAAAAGWILTFGMSPLRPETGYGYIKRGAALDGHPGCEQVARFVEKPDAATAEGYLAEGGYAWNSGMFLASASVMLAELERLQPELVAACRAALTAGARDLDFLRLDPAAFERCPNVSIDYAVMEHTERAAVVPAEIGWSDVGSWDALWDVLPKDEHGNACSGDIVTLDSRNCLLRSDDRMLAVIGAENLAVVSTDDAVLVCPRDQAQRVGELVKKLKADGRGEAELHSEVHRPWGSYRGVDRGARFQVKRIVVAPGRRLSLQSHRHRAEHWIVVAGEAEVTRNEEVFRLSPNQSTYIPLGAIHRLGNPGEEPLHLIEVQSGDYLGEDDIERYEDVYGRS